uniref:cysteine proteinase inhibitor 5-like n=1 Tax=Erigeron canadensis TaxID=72917 RepID=UPI001CB9B595|nr:cysteine proteinase inhibitor 5-like [Erigeron canadensis]
MKHPSKMHNLFSTILIIFLTCYSFDSSFALGEGTDFTGGWKQIPNVTDPAIVDIGKFAVDEHNKEKKLSLVFGKVVMGESQVVAGMNYNLTITAMNAGVEYNYLALVWDKPWQKFRQLTSFNGPV